MNEKSVEKFGIQLIIDAFNPEWYWLAGIFEADGSTSRSRNRQGYRYFQISFDQSGEECPLMLKRIVNLIGSGNVRGPYSYNKIKRWSRMPMWKVSYNGKNAKELLGRLAPYMTTNSPKLIKAMADLKQTRSM